MASRTMNFYNNIDHMQMLVALLKMYNMDSADISAIRSIGFNVHVLTNINDSVLFKANSAIQEASPITARRYSSLLKHGAEVSEGIKYATPSSMKMDFIITEEDFLAKANKQGDVRTYTISKLNTVSVGNYLYSLDYDIEVRLDYGIDDSVFLTARYLKSNEENQISNLENLTIPCIRSKTDTGWVYYLYVTLQQYVREIKEVEFSNRDYQLFPITLQRSTDEIAGIDVYYRNTASTGLITTKKLTQKIFFENSRTSEDSIFIHWDSVNSFTLVHKSQEGGFRPSLGDKLLVYVYVTTGSRANYTYQILEGSSIKLHQKDSGELRIKIKLDPGESVGGESSDLTVEKLRRNIITKKSTYDAIIIENDLYMHLNNRKSGNEYAVIKYRNDILKLFNIFTTLRFQSDGQSCLVPTNTLTLDWKYKQHGEDIKGDNNFYNQTAKCVHSVKAMSGDIIDESSVASLPPDSIVYWNPFIVSYSKSANMVRLYEPGINKQFRTDYNLLNSKVPYSWICNWVKFQKEDYNTRYLVTFELRHNLVNMVPNETLFTLSDPSDPKSLPIDADFFKVFLVLKDSTDQEVYRARCKMMQYDNYTDKQDDFFLYNLELIADGDLTKIVDDQMKIKTDTGTEVWVNVEDLKGSIEVEMPTEKDPVSGLLTTNRQVVNTFNFDCYLTKNRTKDHKIQHTFVDNDTIRLHQYPLVEYSFYKNFKEYYISALSNEYDLERYLSKFQGEFSYSIKFANTYGFSQNYTIGLDSKPLNNVMLNMSFTIETKLGSTITEKQLNATVYNYLSSINFLNYDEFHVSNLQKYVKDSFPDDIEFIQFNGMNGYTDDKQLLSMKVSSINNKTIIERLNLPLLYYADANVFGYKVTWSYR